MKKDAKSENKNPKAGADIEEIPAESPETSKSKKDKKKGKKAEEKKSALPGKDKKEGKKKKKKNKEKDKGEQQADEAQPARKGEPERKEEGKGKGKGKKAGKKSKDEAKKGAEEGRSVLIVVRHGDAGDPSSTNDIVRPLSRKGRKQARRLRSALAALGCTPAAIVSSPAARARETAELLAAKGTPITESDALWESTNEKIRGLLASHTGPWPLAIVGHEPDLGQITAQLAFGGEAGAVPFCKGGVACLELQRSSSAGATLRWLLTAAAVKELA